LVALTHPSTTCLHKPLPAGEDTGHEGMCVWGGGE
jgi:hypothetical protein